MLTYKRFISFLFFLSICTVVFSQNNTNSPYTRYGYGKLADQTFGKSQSMGGIGYGLRSSGHINTLNPASYSAVDSLTFLFDFGLMGQMTHMSDGDNSQSNYNGNLSYLSMQFRLTKGLGMSIGLKPFSYVGYDFGDYQDVGSTYAQRTFSGTGSLTQVYGGLGYEIIPKKLSVGINFGYTFGAIDRYTYLTFPESSAIYPKTKVEEINAHDFFWEAGVQYTQPIGKNDLLTIGGVFSPKQTFSAKNTTTRVVYSSGSSSSLEEDITTTSGQDLHMPMNIGVGFSYTKNKQMTFGADVLYQNWSDVAYPGDDFTFKNRMKYSAGFEYVKDPNVQKGYLKRVRYRLGAYYSDSYVDVMGSGINEIGVTAGLGLPFRMRQGKESMINIGAEYILVKPKEKLIDEQYFRITVGVTFSELWFRKFKFD